jgi:hypothetical protein
MATFSFPASHSSDWKGRPRTGGTPVMSKMPAVGFSTPRRSGSPSPVSTMTVL